MSYNIQETNENESHAADRRVKTIQRTTLIGSIGNLLLTVFKFIAGIFGNSAAMIADAVHSLSDFITDIIVIVFVRIANKPVDTSHSYGHGKYETLATAIIAVMLFAVGMGIFYGCSADIIRFINGEQLDSPGIIALIGAILSVTIKEGLYQYTARTGRKVDSQVMIANAWHHRSDALSSIGTSIGIGGAILLGEQFRVLDPIAATVVSLFIMKVAYDLMKPSIYELLEQSLPEDTKQQIIEAAGTFHDVVQPHNLRTRRVGRTSVVDLHVRMPGDMTVYDSHKVATGIEGKLREFLGPDAIINIHVEPIKE